MAYQISSKDILLAAAVPFIGRAAAGGFTSPAGRVLAQLQASGIAPDEVSPAINADPDATMTPEQVLTLRGNLKAREYPRKDHVTRTMWANGAHNSGLNRAMAEDAARMQSLQEHNDALLRYVRPGMTEAQAHAAITRGAKEEKKLPAYWDELHNRRNFNVRSDAVHAIRITPDGYIQIKWRGKPSKTNPSGWYTFRKFRDTHEASLEAQKLIMSDSLGRAVWPVMTRKGGDKLAAKGYGKWNVANYNAAFATKEE